MNKQIAITIIVLITCFLFFEISHIDISLQDYFFDFQLNRWILDREDKITKLLFYDGIKIIFYIFVLLILIALIFFRNSSVIKEYKQGLIIVCLSTFLVPLSVSILKATTNVPCPKNLEHYGGEYPYVTVLSRYPETFYQAKNIRCYPAGHASGGFALMSLFFLFKLKKNKIIALISTIVIGWSIGSYKMLIGDHFLSHTIITMMLAWLIILNIAKSINKLDL
jgi:membrane-associated PAP2 superfamily phosphatase